MKLPRLQIQKATESQKSRFSRWLAEWEIEQELQLCDHDNMSGEQHQVTDDPLPIAPLSEEPEIQKGQIRLLSPDCEPSCRTPMYFAVLEEDEPDSCIAAPFSRFSEPCTPGELLTNRPAPCLRVLCLWNAHQVSRDAVKKSWLVDEMTPDEINDALALLRNMADNSPLPAPLKTRIGPPMWHPNDPRKIYVRQETERINALFRPQDTTANNTYVQQPGELPKAAEPHSTYETDTPPTPPLKPKR